jgi:serine phosphatase RsbU (regulator of sigma subunit)
MKIQETRTDPKTLYHLIEDVFDRADDRVGGRELLAACARAFLESFRHELGLEAVHLYCQRRHRFHKEASFGTPRREPPAILSPEDGLLGLLESGGAGVEVELTSVPPFGAPVVALLIEEPRARHALFLQLSSAEQGARAETLARPLRAALSARILQNRWGNAFTEAAEIQRGLLPARPPVLPGYEFVARSQPAEEVGGDVYDVVRAGERTMGVMLADASGHGLPAALVARDVVVGMRMGLRSGLKVTRVLENLNEVMHDGGLTSSFVSVFYGELSDDGTMLYANAGHPPPLLYRADGCLELAWGDTVLGPARGARFRRSVVQLEPGDVLVAYTDGLSERRGLEGGMFGLGGIEAALGNPRGVPAEQILDRLFAAAEAYGVPGPWDDDATALVIRREETSAPPFDLASLLVRER